MADVGGYLGLLLGQSAYGIFEIMTHWMRRWKSLKCTLSAWLPCHKDSDILFFFESFLFVFSAIISFLPPLHNPKRGKR